MFANSERGTRPVQLKGTIRESGIRERRWVRGATVLKQTGDRAGSRLALRAPPADGREPARSPVFRRCVRSAEAERGRSLRTGSRPISLRARS